MEENTSIISGLGLQSKLLNLKQGANKITDGSTESPGKYDKML